MASYKNRLIKDLDAWIADGLVPQASREPILARVAERARPDGATALAYIGVALLGLAVIAFVAANWSGIPRVGRYGLVNALLLVTALGAAWTAAKGRKITTNALLIFASLVFAAEIGLVGQSFALAGAPQVALYGAAAGAALLGIAGRSSGALVVALGLAFGGDIGSTSWSEPCVVAAGAIIAVVTAMAWRSPVLAHGAGLAFIFGALEVIARLSPQDHVNWIAALVASALFAAAAFGIRRRGGPLSRIFHGWALLGALAAFGAAGIEAKQAWKVAHRAVLIAASAAVVGLGRRDRSGAIQAAGWLAFWSACLVVGLDVGFDNKVEVVWRIAHRLVCLAGATAMIAFSRHDRNNWITALGAYFMLSTVSMVLTDFGLSLMSAAGVFAASAIVILVVGLILRRRARA